MGDLIRAVAEHPIVSCAIATWLTFLASFVAAQFRDAILRVHIFTTRLQKEDEAG